MKKTFIHAGIGLSIAIINFYSLIWGINSVLYHSESSYLSSYFNEVTIILMIIANSIFLIIAEKKLKKIFSLNIVSIIPILISIAFNMLFCVLLVAEDPLGAEVCFEYLLIISFATFILENIKILVKRYMKWKNGTNRDELVLKRFLIYVCSGIGLAIINCYLFIYIIMGKNYLIFKEQMVVMIITNFVFLLFVEKLVKRFFRVDVTIVFSVMSSFVFHTLFCATIWFNDDSAARSLFKHLLMVSLATATLLWSWTSIRSYVEKNKSHNE